MKSSVQATAKPTFQRVVHFAGDSGDGIQLIGQQFAQSSALLGNDIQTFPDFPAEIRAPQGTPAGVSGFQLKFASVDIHTPGDLYDTLVALNPAAMIQCLGRLKPQGVLILDQDKWSPKEFKKAGLDADPLTQTVEQNYKVHQVAITSLVLKALEGTSLSRAKQRKCKNFFALGLVYWLYQRPLEPTQTWIKEKFKNNPDLIEANLMVLKAGYDFAQTMEWLEEHQTVHSAKCPSGEYRQVTGNEALAFGVLMAKHKIGRPLLVAGYPITPASDILHWFAQFGEDVKTFQAEDEIAAAGAALGAAFAGHLALTTTSGPGMDLKSETLGLAVMSELPMVIVDVQRAGPSTGMPTKVEQSDLLMALYGRHGECPMPVLAPSTPADCYEIMIEAFEMATRAMTPVIVLSDAYLANGAEPWRIPDLISQVQKKAVAAPEKVGFEPYQRDPETLARPWAVPGQAGFEHRLGGLEKTDGTGHISYDPHNHAHMVQTRRDKIEALAQTYPPTEIIGPQNGDFLVIGWGSTKGPLLTAVLALQEKFAISYLHLRHLNPLPNDLEILLKRFKHVMVVELNGGQLQHLIRARYLVDAKGYHKIQGQPLRVDECEQVLKNWMGVHE